jgi:hypothetical protein
MTRRWITRATSVRSALFHPLDAECRAQSRVEEPATAGVLVYFYLHPRWFLLLTLPKMKLAFRGGRAQKQNTKGKTERGGCKSRKKKTPFRDLPAGFQEVFNTAQSTYIPLF